MIIEKHVIPKLDQPITFDNYYNSLPINCSDELPCYLRILDSAYEQLTTILAIHSRVIVVRLDLRVGSYEVDGSTSQISYVQPSNLMSSFLNVARKRMMRWCGGRVAYQWVREYGEKDYNPGCHWHLWMAFRQPRDLQPQTAAEQAQEILSTIWKDQANGGACPFAGWFYLERPATHPERRQEEQALMSTALIDGSNLASFPLKGMRDRAGPARVLGGIVDECFYALSYLAKVRTKHPAGYKSRSFNSSRLECPANRREKLELIKGNLSHQMPMVLL